MCDYNSRHVELGRTEPGSLWAIRSKIEPIEDRQHQMNVCNYIRSHAEAGAAVWSMIRDEPAPEFW